MRTLLTLFLLSSTLAFATKPLDLRGSWIGSHTDRWASTTTKHQSRLTGKRLPDGTVQLSEQLSPFINGPARALTRYSFRRDGRFTEASVVTTIFGTTSTIRVASGTWKSRNGEIRINAKRGGYIETGYIRVKNRSLTFEWVEELKGLGNYRSVKIKARRR